MSDNDTVQDLSMEERLKAVLYQFIKLYERWSEDRQVAAKQGADLEELVALFTEEVNGFKKLVPQIHQYLAKSIQDAASEVGSVIGEEASKEATRAVEHVVRQLANATEKAEKTLERYQTAVVWTQWKVIGVSAITTIATCLLLVWLLIPKPTLPLTDHQIKDIYGGKLLTFVWPKLSEKEQQHWLELAKQITHPG